MHASNDAAEREPSFRVHFNAMNITMRVGCTGQCRRRVLIHSLHLRSVSTLDTEGQLYDLEILE